MLISSSCASALKAPAAAALLLWAGTSIPAAAAESSAAPSSAAGASASSAAAPQGSYQALDPAWQVSAAERHYSAVKSDGTARFVLQLMPADAARATTREGAAALMQRLQGFDLKPVLAQRGYSFSYTDVLPCKGLLSYFDGASYLFTAACGLITAPEFEHFYREGAARLHLQQILQQSSFQPQ